MLNIKNEIKSAFLENKTAVYISIILLLAYINCRLCSAALFAKYL